MKSENRETVQRAIGVICGIAYVSNTTTSDALMDAVEMLDCVLKKEQNEVKGDAEN